VVTTRTAVLFLAVLALVVPSLTARAQMDHSRHEGMAPDQPAQLDHSQHEGMTADQPAQMDHGHNGHGEESGGGMILDREGMVMNHNTDRLPEDCGAVSEDENIEVRVGTKHARTGLTFGYSQHQWRLKPCSRVTVTFINEDQIRHQWMVHGLPKYLYPQGMFHLEVNGGFRKTAAFIVPSGNATLLVHCDISHHMEQGLKGQLVVGRGGQDIPGIPGHYAPRFPDSYE
jgi:hypothetical protein